MSQKFDRQLVVCVDDEPGILSALQRSLRWEPYEVLTTDSPEHALRCVARRDVSVIITDQRMPGMQGTELLLEVSKRSPSTARVILTAYGGSTISTPGLRRWTECIISKPWDNGMLRQTIRQLLSERDMDLFQEEEAMKL